MTQYVNLPADGGLRLTVAEAQSVTELIHRARYKDTSINKETSRTLERAQSKLEWAIAAAPYNEVNKRIAQRAKRTTKANP